MIRGGGVDDDPRLYTSYLPVTFCMYPSFHEPKAYLSPGNVPMVADLLPHLDNSYDVVL
jgi:hypothetical protein